MPQSSTSSNSLASQLHPPEQHTPSGKSSASSSRSAHSSSSNNGHSSSSNPQPRPLTAQELLHAHKGNAERAFHAVITAHNSLVQADAERAKVVTENSKLWTWCSGLKKERDALSKDRVRLERRLAEMQALCKANGLQLPEHPEQLVGGPEEEQQQQQQQHMVSLGRPPGPQRTRSGENTVASRERTISSRSASSRQIAALRAEHQQQQLSQSANDPHRAGVNPDDPRPPMPRSPSASDAMQAPPSPTFHRSASDNTRPAASGGLRRKASSVDLGKPSPTTTPNLAQQSQMQSPDGNAPLTPPQMPKYTLNGLEISSSPFNPTFPASAASSRRLSSMIHSPPASQPQAFNHHMSPPQLPHNYARSEGPSPNKPREAFGRRGSDTAITSGDRLRAGLGLQPSEHGSDPATSSASSLAPVPQGETLQEALKDSTDPAFAPPGSSASRPPTGSSTSSSNHVPDMTRSPHKSKDSRLKISTSNNKQAAYGDPSKSVSALSIASPSTPTPQQAHFCESPSSSRASLRSSALTPAALSKCIIRVESSQIKMNEKSKEVILFFIDVSVPASEEATSPGGEDSEASTPAQHWAVEKLYSDVLQLDTAVKGKHSRSTNRKIASLPDKSLFKDHAPSKVDARKAVLEKYLQSLTQVPLDVKDDVCHFLTTNVVDERNNPVENPASKAGYLTKKGRLIGGWQTRYYALQGPLLEYYDSQGGPHLGQIDITGAQIGRQQNSKETSGDTYRHAFLIRESRRSGRSDASGDVDHILCAESDSDRDDWVRVLAAWATGEYVQPPDSFMSQSKSTSSNSLAETDSAHGHLRPFGAERKMSGDPGTKAQPLSGVLGASHMSKYSQPSQNQHQRDDSSGRASLASDHLSTSDDSSNSRTNRNLQSDMPPSRSIPHSLDGNAAAAAPHNRPSSQQSHHENLSSPTSQNFLRPASPSKVQAGKISGPMNGQIIGANAFKPSRADRQAKVKSSFWSFARPDKQPAPVVAQTKPVFGVPLADAVARAQVREGFELPAVVFRCVEYLQAKSAVNEEGLYRLSGSTNVIKGLKDKFNAEGDVNLLGSNSFYDPHAIAGLLKLFLRELPINVLTRELHPSFLRVVDLAHRREKVNELGSLVAQLPVANYTLLRFLSSHLQHVVENESVNKMTLRNIGIVFSPTLGIPATLFNLFLTEFSFVFRVLDDQPAPLMIEEEDEVDSFSPEAPANRSSQTATTADTSVDTITNDTTHRRQSRNSMYYSSSGADLLLEPHTAPVAEDEEGETEAEESEHESLSSNNADAGGSRSLLPSLSPQPTTAPSSVGSETPDVTETLASAKNAKGLTVKTGSGFTASMGLPSSPSPRAFPSSPRGNTPRPGVPLSPRAAPPTQ